MAFARGIGAILRSAGKALEDVGCAVQGKLAYRETCKQSVFGVSLYIYIYIYIKSQRPDVKSMNKHKVHSCKHTPTFPCSE